MAARAEGAGPRIAQADLSEMLARLAQLLTGLIAFFLAAPVLAMLDSEALAIAEPGARIINRHKVLKKYARHLIDGQDYIQLALGLSDYGRRVMQAVSETRPASPKASAPAQGKAAANGSVGPIEGSGASEYGGFIPYGAASSPDAA